MSAQESSGQSVRLDGPAGATRRVRYHALDCLRAVMMSLGLLLHAAASYVTLPLGAAWPYRDPSTSPV